MSDLDLTKKTNVSRNQNNAGSPQNLKDQMADAGADMKQRADETLRAAGDTARDTFQEATEAAKNMASDTADKLQDQVREQQHTGADFVNKYASNIREAARAFENDVPFAAGVSIPWPNTSKTLLRSYVTGASAISWTTRPILPSTDRSPSWGSPCSLVLLRFASSRRQVNRHCGPRAGSTIRRLRRMGIAGIGHLLQRTQVRARIRVLPHSAASAVVTGVRVPPHRAPLEM